MADTLSGTMVQEPIMQERRDQPRLESYWIADISHLEHSYSAQVNNISQGGVELVCPDDWHPAVDEVCQISLQLTNNKTLTIDMHVCWIADTSIGMQFERLSGSQKRLLNKMLSSLSQKFTLAESHFVM